MKYKKYSQKLLPVVVIFAFVWSGCATIIQGSSQVVKIKSEPPDAALYVDNVAQGKTPAEVSLTRSENHYVQVKKPGYKKATALIEKRFSPWFLGNFIFLSLFWVGMIVDSVTGAMWKLEPPEVLLKLENVSGNTANKNPVPAGKAVNIAVLDLFPGTGIEREKARFLSDILRSFLANDKRFTLVDRNNMEAILKEQGFQISDYCDSSECSVRVGRLLGVEKMVSGTIGRLGERLMVTLQILDVETGRIDAAAENSCNYCSEEDLPELLRECAQKMVDKYFSGQSSN